MRIQEARKLKIGQKVITPMGFIITVTSLTEFRHTIGNKVIIYVKGKTEEGNIMKFSHKELKII